VASIYPCAQQQKLVKLVFPVENLMCSSVNLDGGYMKRSFVCSQWFLLSSETTASRVDTGPTSEKSNTKTQRTSTNLWPDDIYNYVNLVSSLPDSKKYEILCNHWKPGSDFSFPPHENIGRRLRFAWLSRFPWLAYSAVANSGFCITCVFFGGESTHNASKLQ
jgi:hypothetical protein